MGKAYPLRSGFIWQDLKAALQDSGRLQTIHFEDNTRFICRLTNFKKDVRFQYPTTGTYLTILIGDYVNATTTTGFRTLSYANTGNNILNSHLVIDEEYFAHGWDAVTAGQHGFQFIGKASNGEDIAFGMSHYNNTTFYNPCNWVYIRPDGEFQDIAFSFPIKEIRTVDLKYISTDVLIYDVLGLVMTDANNIPLTIRHLKSLSKLRDVNRGYTLVTDIADAGGENPREVRQMIIEGGYTIRGNSVTNGLHPTSFVLPYQA